MNTGRFNDVVAGRAPAPLPFTVEQFHKMVGHGILVEGDPVELIDGVVMHKDRAAVGEGRMVHGRRHAATIAQIQRLLEQHTGRYDCHIRTQLPVTLSKTSEPEPDLALVEGAPNRYLARHPAATDVLVVVEVADSSLDYDRRTKCALYAASGIATYWIVNLIDDQIEVHALPDKRKRRYSRQTVHTMSHSVSLRLSDGTSIELAVKDLIPAGA
ncbi:MAG: hypothetical protein B7Z73_08770 [Planctomycetia bacterium 21-64-5]|nr:MAG: hypothetical protein B7Z73_08770 [Planctomycetia bacterium 21-64-5]HQU42869.1 Uma2 family endonuclease [Pirellulales bacterium]